MGFAPMVAKTLARKGPKVGAEGRQVDRHQAGGFLGVSTCGTLVKVNQICLKVYLEVIDES